MESGKANRTAVVIVNWNGVRFLPPLLQSIREANPAEIIVVDNASTDGSKQYLREQTEIKIIENEENIGFGRGANRGIQISTTPYVLLLNVDTQAFPNSVETLQRFLDQHAGTGIVAPQLLFPDGKLQPSCRRFPTLLRYSLFLSYLDYFIPAGYTVPARKHQETMNADQPMGAVLMIRKSAFDATGCFDPRFTLYMEEIDLCKRIKEKGWEIVYLPEAKFIHHAGGSTSQDWERSQIEYFQNVIRYFQKHFPEKSPGLVRGYLSAGLVVRSFVLLLIGRFRQSRFYFKQALKPVW